LISQGISAVRLSSAGFGGTKPIANNNTEEGRTLNRRVDLILK
jgi:outer membrane protein OmpA-like peptidoglycan-associated protein